MGQCIQTCAYVQAMLKYDPESGEVQLVVDRGYREGEPIKVWFGPQPNQRAFLNYGIVDEDNPHDKMTLEVSICVYLMKSLIHTYSLMQTTSSLQWYFPSRLCLEAQLQKLLV